MRTLSVSLALLCLLLLSRCTLPTKHHHSGVLDLLHNASELASAEFVLEKIVIADKSKKLLHLVPLKEASFVANTEATVKTGIDFGKIQQEDVHISGNSITLTLPPIEVVDFSYPANKVRLIEEYSHLHTLGNSLSLHEIDGILQDAQLQIMESVNHLKIRPISESKVKSVLNNLLKLEGFEQVVIHFKQTDDPLMWSPSNSSSQTGLETAMDLEKHLNKS
ncbi:MAG: DUF4230 domain-containing protein [Bacteroidota bacterium]